MKIHVGIPRDGLVLDERRIRLLEGSPEAHNDPVLQAALRALQTPSREASLETSGPASQRRISFAYGPDLVAVLLARQDRPLELAAITHDSVPAVIAKTLGLGPARAPEAHVLSVANAEIVALTRPPFAVTGGLSDSPLGRRLAEKSWGVARFETRLHSSQDRDADEASFEILGAAQTGWWWIKRGRRHASLVPTRPAMIWGLLSSVLGED